MTLPTDAFSTAAIQFRPVAEHALLVEFGARISQAVNEAVHQLDSALNADPFHGMTETVPGYVNLLVGFDPVLTDHPGAERAIRERLANASSTRAVGRVHRIAVCYDDELGPDLDEVARQTGLTREAVIACHLSGDYRVYLYGFAPGYAYLAGVPEPLQLPRKPAAVRGIAAGSVIIAGPQCLITTFVMPTGWWIIGRSPARIIDESSDSPFLFDVGDTVRLQRVSRDAFDNPMKRAV